MTTTEEPPKELAVVPVEEVEKLQTTIAQSGVEATTAQQLLESFRPIFAEVHKIIEQAKAAPVVTDATQLTEMNMVRTIRLALARQRIAGEKLKDKLKADSLLRGKAIQGVYNVLEFMVKPLEDSLLASEKFAERAEAARMQALRESRFNEITPFLEVSPHWLGDLSALSKSDWEKTLADAKLLHQTKIDAAAKAEVDRIAKEKADAEERERVRLENERLKQEAIAREAAAKAEREAAAAEVKRLTDIAAKETARIEAKAKAEHEDSQKKLDDQKAASDKAAKEAAKERAEVESKAKAEREEAERKAAIEQDRIEAAALKEREARQKAEAETKALRDAEAKKKEDEEAARKKAAAAPDRNKLIAFANAIASVPVPVLLSERARLALETAETKLAEVSNELIRAANAL